jgi:hypothetical protein
MPNSIERITRQIIPAQEWNAFYLLPNEPYHALRRLICWQLDELAQSGEFEIVGIVSGGDKSPTERASDLEGFHSYTHDSNVNNGELRPVIGEHRKKLGF